MSFEVTPRERRWLDALLVLAVVTLVFVVLGYLANLLAAFGDLILVFFLAWLLAFILTPLVTRVATIPFMSRTGAVFIVYILLFGGLVVLAVTVAGALASSVTDFIASVPSLRSDLPRILSPWQQRLDDLGIVVNLAEQGRTFLDNLNRYATQLAGPLQQIAVASLGALANLLLIVVLSLYMVADRDRLLAWTFRLVPPQYKDEAKLLETSVARSFGGFLRGQAIMGVVYAAVALTAGAVLGLDYAAGTAAAAGILMAIPFFGPFFAWAPPVLVALFVKPDVVLPTLAIMAVGWLLVMNLIQPRLMASALRIHPIIVLGSVLVGGKIAGISGAIFGIPIAAVLSAFFLHSIGRSVEGGPVTTRAAQRLGRREGRNVRVPREPDPATDADVETDDASPAEAG
ncbi:MAG TPA: AI-2E family transporter [Candidatus Limnocylindrales bacterium]|nr:AI-2E family transporter [Candidatus Limnocylindrales bacterium]